MDRDKPLQVTDRRDAPHAPGEGARDIRSESILRGLLEPLATELSADLSTLTGREVSLSPLRWAKGRQDQFLSTVRELTCCCTLRPSGNSSAPALLEIGPLAAWLLIDSLLGGPADGSYRPSRALTAVEQRLIRRVAERVCGALTRMWPVKPAPVFEVQSRKFSAAAGISDLSGPAMALDFALTIGDRSDTLRLLLPETLLGGPIVGGATRRNGPVEISVVTDEMTLPAAEVAALAAGDILTTDATAEGEVIVRVAGIPKYRARLGSCNGHRAITILGPIELAAHAPASVPAAAADDDNMDR